MLNFILNVIFQLILLVFKPKTQMRVQLVISMGVSAICLALFPFTVGFISNQLTAFIITACVVTFQGNE
jgi:hypothetical protein